MSFPIAERLIFKAWSPEDLSAMDTLNSNAQTMAHFPETLNRKASEELLQRFMIHFDEHGFTYYPVWEKEGGAFIGFIGCKWQNYEHPACPHVDIGWRLLPEFWGKGYATEGAKACLEFIFKNYKLDAIYSVAPAGNRGSISVMQKIGMVKIEEFNHPNLTAFPAIQLCEMYKISR